MKKILFLGAATFQIPPIAYALEQGYYVITSDNRPQNPGHRLAHKSYNVSTIDKGAVLEIAQKENIDGILSFGSDVSAPTAAYVSDQMQLPGSRYETSIILTNKARFRRFLKEKNLQEQSFKSFSQQEKNTIAAYLKTVKLPVVAKPVDASGSKGVSIIHSMNEWQPKVEYAFKASISKNIIIEQYIVKKGYQICGDGYMENGKLVFVEFGDGHFYKNHNYLAPYAETFPSTHTPQNLQKVHNKLEHILQAAGYHTGAFNLDVMITFDNEVFVNEIGPRSGGNYIPLAIKLIANVDLTAAVVEASINPSHLLNTRKERSPFFYACFMMHTRQQGILKEVVFDPEIKDHIIYKHPYLEAGDAVLPFHQANQAIGNIVLRFDSQREMLAKMAGINNLCHVKLV